MQSGGYFHKCCDVTRRWMAECVTYKDNTYPQLLQIGEITLAKRHFGFIKRFSKQSSNPGLVILKMIRH